MSHDASNQVRGRPSGAEAKARTVLRVAGPTTALGILLASAGDPALARWLTVIGLGLLVVGLHRFGRLGADDPSIFDDPTGR